MTQHALDYERLGRQIALLELGERGQRALADTPVSFSGPAPAVALASRIAERAGMRTTDSPTETTVPVHASDNAPLDAVLVAGAWAALEGARRVLGLPSRASLPHDLAERVR